MGSRYRKQEEIRIDLDGGDWLLVRKHLTAGEERSAMAKMFKPALAGERPQVDLEQLGIAQAVSYLLDWSLTDADDKPIVIRDRDYGFVAAAINAQSPESSREILDAIAAHDTAMADERAHQKKVRSGEPVPDPTSTSAD